MWSINQHLQPASENRQVKTSLRNNVALTPVALGAPEPESTIHSRTVLQKHKSRVSIS